MNPFKILHLSDIHIGDTYVDSEQIAYRIISDMENENIKHIKCVIVSGDIFEGKKGNNKEIINEAVKFFNIIHQELSVASPINKEDFLFVPGNHDIVWDDDKDKKWDKYRQFLTSFYGKIPDFYLDNFSLVKVYDENRIAFIGLNSCALKSEPVVDKEIIKSIDKIGFTENDNINKQELIDFLNNKSDKRIFVDYGEISHDQILNVKRKLIDINDYNIVAFFHHHFYLFPEVYSKHGDSSLITNYTAVTQQLQQMGVRTVLHGHKHLDLERPLITDSYYENPNNIIDIIAGGSVGTSRVPKHTFNIIELFDKENDIKLLQKKFVYNNDQLEPIINRQIPPLNNDSGIKKKLLNTLDTNDHELFNKYNEKIEAINIAADDYNNIGCWLENIFVGFTEVYKILEKDPLCILFLFYAMNYRTLVLKNEYGKEDIDNSYFEKLRELLSSIDNIDFNINDFFNMINEIDLINLKEKCDIILNAAKNKRTKKYLAFSMIGIFITDLYMVLRYYADEFYNKRIKYKVNIKLDENEYHQNVPVQKIMIYSDVDRRSAYINLSCNSATAHKLSVLFVKEFELIINRFEDYFKIIGLKIYYLVPKIEKGNVQEAIDNYNFEAYIPTLIPLLTGDNIYAKKEVFSRELIQNSIDAIAVRAAYEEHFDKTIYVSIKEDTNDRFCFSIKDYGTGMDRFKIERYFTSIGRSFYSGDEYKDLELQYKPISNFGIGFLSAFMVCREIDVRTKHYMDETEGLKLHIPNYDGCFFIEKDRSADIGTEIVLHVDRIISNNISYESIIKYIMNVMRDINVNIKITNNISDQEISVCAHSARLFENKQSILFIPFLEDGTVKKDIDLKDDVWSGNFIKKYPYGLIINLSDEENPYFGGVLNSGILLSETSVNEVWRLLLSKNIDFNRIDYDNLFMFNFPSNYLNVDVSREKINDFSKEISNRAFLCALIKEFKNQTQQIFDLSRTNEIPFKAFKLYNAMRYFSNLYQYISRRESDDIFAKDFMYKSFIKVNEKSFELIISRKNIRTKNTYEISPKNVKIISEKINNIIKKQATKQKELSLSHKDFIRLPKHYFHHYSMVFDDLLIRSSYEDAYRKMKEEIKRRYNIADNKTIYTILIFTLLEYDDVVFRKKNLIDLMLLNEFTISDIEKKLCKIEITLDDLISLFEQIRKIEN